MFLTYTLHARDIILVSYTKEAEYVANSTITILREQEKIPDSLITKRESINPCQKIAEAIVQICIIDSERVFFPVIKKEIILSAYRIFKQKQIE